MTLFLIKLFLICETLLYFVVYASLVVSKSILSVAWMHMCGLDRDAIKTAGNTDCRQYKNFTQPLILYKIVSVYFLFCFKVHGQLKVLLTLP